MTIQELLKSEASEKFNFEILENQPDKLWIWKPQSIIIPIAGLEISENETVIYLEIPGRYSITLYKKSGITHTSIS